MNVNDLFKIPRATNEAKWLPTFCVTETVIFVMKCEKCIIAISVYPTLDMHPVISRLSL